MAVEEYADHSPAVRRRGRLKERIDGRHAMGRRPAMERKVAQQVEKHVLVEGRDVDVSGLQGQAVLSELDRELRGPLNDAADLARDPHHVEGNGKGCRTARGQGFKELAERVHRSR
jgi:hypothetical protein